MTPTGQLELSDLTNLGGAAWLDSHPRAEQYLADRARFENAQGRKARIHALMEELLARPKQYGLDMRDDGTPYLLSKNEWAGIARELMARYGVEFTLRRTKHDAVTA